MEVGEHDERVLLPVAAELNPELVPIHLPQMVVYNVCVWMVLLEA